MAGLFSTFNTANKGLMAQQTALHTVGHNISNANTKGFSRQRVEMKADLPFHLGGVGQLGTGVKIDGVIRVVDPLINKQIRNENSTLNWFQEKSFGLDQLEVVFNEPSTTGLNSSLANMFNSWQELSKNPENLASKTMVIEQTKTLTDNINHMANQIDTLRDGTVDQMEKNALDFNATIDQLNNLNQQIFNIAVKGHPPNDLLDQRDMLLNDLSDITSIDAKFDEYGRVAVDLKGEGGEKIEILSHKSLKPAKMKIEENVTEDKKEVTVKIIGVDEEGDPIEINLDVKSGALRGNKEALEQMNERKEDLNDFARTMAEKINEVHKDAGGEDIYTIKDGADNFNANNIRANPAILKEPGKIVAGATSDSPDGDGSTALKIANLRSEKIKFGEGTDKEKETTILGAYMDMVTKVGISKEHADKMIANQDALLGQLEYRRESVSGVSIDEEITNLIKYQSAYQANARVISTISEMLDTLINRTGV